MNPLLKYVQRIITGGGHIHPGQLVTQTSKEIASDVSTNSASWEDLLVVNYDKKVNESSTRIVFSSSSSSSNTNGQVRFGIFIDDVLHRGCGCRGQGNFSQAATVIHLMTNMPAGRYVIAIKWQVTVGSARIRPVTHKDDESATLLVEELLVP